MKKKALRLALVAVLLVGMQGGIGAAPASAAHAVDLCVASNAIATLATGLFAIGVGPPVVASVIAVEPIVCASGIYSGTGTVSGHLAGAWVTATVSTPPTVIATTTTTSGTGAGGWCGHSIGTVTVTAGGSPHTGTWLSAGTQLVITGPPTGGVVGSVNAIVAATVVGNSCLNGTATVFLVTGAVTLT